MIAIGLECQAGRSGSLPCGRECGVSPGIAAYDLEKPGHTGRDALDALRGSRKFLSPQMTGSVSQTSQERLTSAIGRLPE